jgi:Tol biopolymer transport system component
MSYQSGAVRPALLTLLVCLLLTAAAARAAAQSASQGRASGRIAFSSNQNSNSDIYMMFPTGFGVTRVTTDIADDVDPDFSPDGARLVYSTFFRVQLNIINADGTGLRTLVPAESDTINGWPAWSPDGERIAFTRRVQGAREDIYLVNSDGTSLQRLTTDTDSLDFEPAWSPDGTKIAFTRVMFLPGEPARIDIWVMNADGSNLVNLTNTDDPFPEFSPSWSPDGTRIVYSRNNTEIWVMNADGSGHTFLTANGQEPDWSPDGTRIAFAAVPDGESDFEIYTIAADGSGRTRLTTNTWNDSMPTWQPVRATQLGEVVISEFRTHGSNSQDEFVELYNMTDAPVTVGTTDGSNGWALASIGPDGATTRVHVTIPAGIIIPPRGHYLIATSPFIGGYNLTGYAVPDTSSLPDFPDNTGLALFNTGNPANFSAATRLDAVGFAALSGPSADLFREGTGLAPGPSGGSSAQHSYVRTMTTGGVPQDTNNNAADFIFVSTDGGTFNGRVAVLGAPGPQNSTSPRQRNAEMPLSLLDPAQAASAPPNRVRNLTPVTNGANGTLSIRRRVTNNTGASVTRLRFRITAITTLNSTPPGSNFADLRALSSGDVVVSLTGGGTTTVRGTTVEEPPSQPLGGGLNTSLAVGTVSTGAPLAPGASVDVQFLLGVQRSGPFHFFINVEALP